jgi:Uma2 family endonuclease
MTVAAYQQITPVPIDFSTLHFTDEQFYQICLSNPDLSFELTNLGTLIVIAPVGGDSGNREASAIGQLYNWNESTALGKVFSSSTIFKLPLGSKRSPDAAWVEINRWNALSIEEREKFPPIAPDLVIEIRSRTDVLTELQAKMLEYQANSVKLGFLINPQDRQAEIYRLGQIVEVLQSPTALSGENLLPGFSLNLAAMW